MIGKYMTTSSKHILTLIAGFCFALAPMAEQVKTFAAPLPANAAASTDTVMHAAELEELVPKTVFFRGQSAPVQLRNSGGVKFSDGFYFFASLVDTSGYSSGIQAKYQAYFITEVPLELGDHKLQPGAYGVGFVADHHFTVMDIGAHDLFTVDYERDEALHRPTPLQVISDPTSGKYRLYEGRNFVSLSRAR